MLAKSLPNGPIAVIGAGAGGLPAATAIAEEGFDVLLIDRGREVPRNEFQTSQYDYELKRPYPWASHSDEWKGPSKLQRGLGLGGSTLYFQAVSHLPPTHVLDDWGLDTTLALKYAREVIEFLKISGGVQPAHKLNPVSQYLYQSAIDSNWKTRIAPAAILSQPHDGRPACNRCGQCSFGCYIGDKSSANLTWLPRLKRTGRVRILQNATVDFLELDSESTVKSIKVSDSSSSYTVPVSAVVIAAGVLETPYLLKNSKQPYAPNGIGNKYVGRYLTGSIWHSLLVDVQDVPQGGGHAGIPIDILIDEFEDQGILLFQGRNLGGIIGPVSAAKFYHKKYSNRGVREWMRVHYPRLAGLGGFAESTTAFDDGLIPDKGKAFSKFIKEGDIVMTKKIRGHLKQWANASNATILNEMGMRQAPYVGAMFRGTCRLGREEVSAVHPDGRLQGYKNIVISDASVIGKGLIANPSLVLQTLGLYFGRELASRLKAT